jgi:biopolymer transport protein ExbD
MRRGTLTARRGRRSGAAIEITPLIDMVFILLIFYIVSTSFVQDAGVRIDRPASAAARQVTARYLPVAITKRGTVHVAGRTIRPDDAAAIEAALRDTDTRTVVIQADRDVPTGLLLRVHDACFSGGAETVNVAALPR